MLPWAVEVRDGSADRIADLAASAVRTAAAAGCMLSPAAAGLFAWELLAPQYRQGVELLAQTSLVPRNGFGGRTMQSWQQS